MNENISTITWLLLEMIKSDFSGTNLRVAAFWEWEQ